MFTHPGGRQGRVQNEPAAPDSPRATGGSVVPAIDAPLQVDIQGRFVEIRGSLPPEWVGVLSSNRSSVRLTAAATRGLIKVFEERDGIDFLTAPRMTTLSNRGAEISVSDVKVIDGKNAGPTLQVIPDVSNPAIELSVFASIVQMLGYEPASNGASEPLIRTNLASGRERIWDGQSVLMDAGALTNRVHFVDKVPYLGDLPLVGRFFREEGTQDQVSRLFVLVTPTLIDAAGRPIHDPAHPPFDPATFPPKP
jgi:type II secretory pathway component GspD/PulD (secretin)